MIGCSTEDMLIDKSFQDQTTPFLTPPLPLLVDLPNHDLYLFHHIYPEHLPFTSEHHQLSLKPNDINGDGNSLKKNSWKNHLKVLKKTPSSSSGLALKIELMIQLPSRGVMLQFFLSIYLIHILITHAHLPFLTCLIIHCFSLSYMFHMQPYLTSFHPRHLFHLHAAFHPLYTRLLYLRSLDS